MITCKKLIHNKDESLKEVLIDCNKAAKEGYDNAKNSLIFAQKLVDSKKKEIENFIQELDKNDVNSETLISLKKQLREIALLPARYIDDTMQQLSASYSSLETFNITLFGRTMTGKSTLYEILTNGDGKTIGNGSQRTTKDVRTYLWNELKIKDVPGIAAYEGLDDEKIAEDAAKDADLLILLITDDAPQNSEAQHFAKIIQLGKPYLGIINIKAGIERAFDRKRFIDKEGYKAKFDSKHINGIFNSLKDLTQEYVGSHHFKRFIPTHLQSKFIGDRENNQQLIEISQFSNIEQKIIQEVKQQGVFYRYNHYLSLIINVYLNLVGELLGYSEVNSQLGRIVIDKQRQVSRWAELYIENINDRIDTEVKLIFAPLKGEVPSFVDDYIESDMIQDKFNSLVKVHKIEENLANLQNRISMEIQRKIENYVGELEKSISIRKNMNIRDREIKKSSIFNSKRAVNWATTIMGGVLTIVAVFTPVGAIAAVSAVVIGIVGSIISSFFDSKQDKLTKAKENAIHKIIRDLGISEYQALKNTKNWFHSVLKKKYIYGVRNSLNKYVNSYFELADKQRKTSFDLLKEVEKINKLILNKIVNTSPHLSKEELSGIKKVGYVPGEAMCLLIEPGIHISSELKKSVKQYLSVPLFFVIDTGSRYSIIRQAIGGSKEKRVNIRVDERAMVAYIRSELSSEQENRLMLAQQIVNYHIIKE